MAAEESLQILATLHSSWRVTWEAAIEDTVPGQPEVASGLNSTTFKSFACRPHFDEKLIEK
jgi:hypothetical protein